jgi:rhodanese-related sulfurtransferase
MRILGSLVLVSLLAACASPPAAAPTSPPLAATASDRVDGPMAHKLVGDGAALVDVRTPEEYAAKHLDGAINVPVDDVATHDFGSKDKSLVLYCMHGQRSSHAADVLRSNGYTHVYLLGAMSAWGQ